MIHKLKLRFISVENPVEDSRQQRESENGRRQQPSVTPVPSSIWLNWLISDIFPSSFRGHHVTSHLVRVQLNNRLAESVTGV